jgi:hypothetical protein
MARVMAEAVDSGQPRTTALMKLEQERSSKAS